MTLFGALSFVLSLGFVQINSNFKKYHPILLRKKKSRPSPRIQEPTPALRFSKHFSQKGLLAHKQRMKKVVVLEEPLSRKYCAPRLSCTYLFIALSNILALILPLYFFTGTDGDFWMIHGTYREQPNIKFLYKCIVVLEATSSTTGQKKEIFVSTMDSLNVLRPESFRMASVQFHEEDIDLDGRIDFITLETNVPIAADEEIHGMKVLLFFNFRLQKRVKLEMETVAYTSIESGAPIGGFNSKGSLMLRQANPLGIRNYSSFLYAKDTPLVGIFDTPSARRITDSNINRVLKNYRERDVAADYVERYPIKTRGIVSAEAGKFNLKMRVDIPEQNILYVATLPEVLKDGWVKYLSVVTVCWFFIERMKRFALRNFL